jgi:hypothetical protein
MPYVEFTLEFGGRVYRHGWDKESGVYWADEHGVILPTTLSALIEIGLSSGEKESDRRWNQVFSSGRGEYSLAEASRLAGIEYKTLYYRLRRGLMPSNNGQNGHIDKGTLLRLIEQNANAINGWPAVRDFTVPDDRYHRRFQKWCSTGEIHGEKDALGNWRVRPTELGKIGTLCERAEPADSIEYRSGRRTEEHILLTEAAAEKDISPETLRARAVRNAIPVAEKDGRLYVSRSALGPKSGEVLRIYRAARELGVSRQTLIAWRKKGKIRMVQEPGGWPGVPASEVERLRNNGNRR